MKKSVLFIALILFMTSFVLAVTCGPAPPHGVKIGDECFDCGVADGICPIDFGVPPGDCLGDPDCEPLPAASGIFWSLDNDTEITDDPLEVNIFDGITLYMVITNTGLSEGTTVDMNVFENEIWPTNDENLGTFQGTVDADEKLIGTFDIVSENDLGVLETGLYEIYFESTEGNSEGYLNINTTDVGGAGAIGSCGDYTDNVSCDENAENVGIAEGFFDTYGLGPGCRRREDLIGCEWNDISSTCSQLTAFVYDPANEGCDETLTSCSYAEEGKTECGPGEDAFIVTYSSVDEGCEDWTSAPIPCPQQLKVPFFGIYGFLMSLCFISLIYIYLIFKRK